MTQHTQQPPSDEDPASDALPEGTIDVAVIGGGAAGLSEFAIAAVEGNRRVTGEPYAGRHAASLQRIDSELSQVEHLLAGGDTGIGGNCPACGAVYGHGAAFCSQCAEALPG